MTEPLEGVYLSLQSARQGQAAHSHVREIAERLRPLGIELEVVAPDYDASRAGAFRRMLEFARIQREVAKRRPRPEVLYIRSHFAALPAAMWARRRGIPVVQELNGPLDDLFEAWPWTRRLAPLFRWAAYRQFRIADALIVNTPGLGRWLEAETGRASTVVPTGADPERFRPGAEPLPGVGRPYALFFGALARWHGLDAILAAPKDASWPSGVRLVVAGDGVERALVEAAAAALPGRIVYLGPVPLEKVPRLLSGALAGLCMTTQRQSTGTSPLKFFETMAAGVPAVVADVPIQADIAREEHCGIVVPVDDGHALAEAVAQLAEDPAEAAAMGARGREAVLQRHSWQARAEATAEVIESACARAGRAASADRAAS